MTAVSDDAKLEWKDPPPRGFWSELARRIGVSKTLLCHVRAGRRKLTARQRAAAARVLGVPESVLDELVLRSSK